MGGAISCLKHAAVVTEGPAPQNLDERTLRVTSLANSGLWLSSDRHAQPPAGYYNCAPFLDFIDPQIRGLARGAAVAPKSFPFDVIIEAAKLFGFRPDSGVDTFDGARMAQLLLGPRPNRALHVLTMLASFHLLDLTQPIPLPREVAAQYPDRREPEVTYLANLFAILGQTPPPGSTMASPRICLEALKEMAGVDLDLIAPTGRTPLHDAVRAGNLGTLEALIRARVKLDKLDNDASMPLDLARMCNNEAAVKMLIKAGAHAMFNYYTLRPAEPPLTSTAEWLARRRAA